MAVIYLSNLDCFMKKLIIVLIVLIAALYHKDAQAQQRQYYELRTYVLANDTQQSRVESYLEKSLIPALKRQGIRNIGAFAPIANDTAATRHLYLLIPFDNIQSIFNYESRLSKDEVYMQNGADYLKAKFDNIPYLRQERVLLHAFKDHPIIKKPTLKSPREERVYELRSYEGHTESIFSNKVKMFNEGGEIRIFEKLGFNAVFYGEALYGHRMPNLIYMTSFENIEARNAQWKRFGDDPDWKKLSSMSEYQNNVSLINSWLLRSRPYSDL